MNREWDTAKYTTRIVEDRVGGSVGVELYREKNGTTECAARILYWDASGQFAFESFFEIPLNIVEEAIIEAKAIVGNS